jgi:alpha-beta hydrolase superfamily lysophospholipase
MSSYQVCERKGGVHMKYWYTVWVLASVLMLSGCDNTLHRPVGEKVVGGTKIVDVNGALVKQFLIENNVTGIDANTTIYGMKAYKIIYDSTDIHGDPIKASGYMVIPKGMPELVEKQIGFSLVSDDHGTIFSNSEAPSVMPELTMLPGQDSSVIFTAMGGFVTLMPDYVGYGESKGAVHPFVLKEPLASDTVAFIKAAKRFAEENHIKLNGQLFVTGYSEGGYASMATLQKIESEGNLSVAMAAPMAGPYDLNLTAFGVLSQPQLSVPSFMAYVAYAYGTAYDEPLDTVINEPYASKLPTLFDGSKTRAQIDPELTTVTAGANGLFNPLFVQSFFVDSTQWFRQAVLENSVHAWVPQTPVRLIHCQGDQVIPFAISQATVATMQAMGASNVALIPVEAALQQAGQGDGTLMGHAECAPFAYGIAAQSFAAVRQQTVGY